MDTWKASNIATCLVYVWHCALCVFACTQSTSPRKQVIISCAYDDPLILRTSTRWDRNFPAFRNRHFVGFCSAAGGGFSLGHQSLARPDGIKQGLSLVFDWFPLGRRQKNRLSQLPRKMMPGATEAISRSDYMCKLQQTAECRPFGADGFEARRRKNMWIWSQNFSLTPSIIERLSGKFSGPSSKYIHFYSRQFVPVHNSWLTIVVILCMVSNAKKSESGLR